MKNIVIIGATSAIASETAKLLAKPNTCFYLLAKDAVKLSAISQDLTVRGAESVTTDLFDASDLNSCEQSAIRICNKLSKIDILLIAYGNLPNQSLCEADLEKTYEAITINFTSILAFLTPLANHMATQKTGCIAVISSVAGDRGRKSNYIYGTAKAALSVFLGGMRNRLSANGIHVLTIKPGFVDTPMTADFTKNALWAKPQKIALDIERAISTKKEILYTPFWWRYILMIICAIPERIFKRLSL
jgi:decaprenylphospho-beta-D-erythro-pentofuranosid-2-ulose 2-reductase